MARRFSIWRWLRDLIGPAPGRRQPRPLSEQESRTLAEFGKHFGITFHDPALLKLALTHRSYLSMTGQGPSDSNERLEFLGDSVLGLVTSEFLFLQRPDEHEGQLTKIKSLLVSKAILSRRALAMGLGRFVLMSHSEVESGGRQRLSILADAFEAVLGAIYLDQGFDAARSFIDRWLLRDSRAIASDERHINYKSHLQEYVQSTFHTHPVYRIRSEYGPDHSKHFNVDVMVGKRVLGSGKGRNKKEAEQAAARSALDEAGALPKAGDREARSDRSLDESLAHEATHERAAMDRPEEIDERLAVDDGPGPDEERAAPRRRGRRGGRGRRPREGEAQSAGPAASEPAEKRPAAASGPRTSVTDDAPTRPFVEPAAKGWRRVRVAEEEYDEIGRPEGPLDERHVDPFDWDAPAHRPERTTHEEPGNREVRTVHAERVVRGERAPLKEREEQEEQEEQEEREQGAELARHPEPADEHDAGEPTTSPKPGARGDEVTRPIPASGETSPGEMERPQVQFGRRAVRSRQRPKAR